MRIEQTGIAAQIPSGRASRIGPLDDHGSGAVTEEDTVATLPTGCIGEGVGAHDDRPSGHAGFDHRGSHCHGEKETRTYGGNIEGDGAVEPGFRLHDAGGGGSPHVGAGGREYDQVDTPGRDPRIAQCGMHRTGCEIGCRFFRTCNAPLRDPQ